MRLASTINKDTRIEIFQFPQACVICKDPTLICFIVKKFPIKLCGDCSQKLKGLIQN